MTNDRLISLSEAAKLTPGRPHTATLTRWCRPGIKARTGERVRLKHWRVGRKIFTTPEALEEFFERTAEADLPHFSDRDAAQAPAQPSGGTRSDDERAEAVARAKDEALT